MNTAQLATTQNSIPVFTEIEDAPLMGSRNHSYVQVNLAIALAQLKKYVVYAELSLDIEGKEYKPDICLYPLDNEPKSLVQDVVRETRMPLLAVEILSPRQVMMDILDKFTAYFKAGIQSAWIIIPEAHTVLVYSDLETVMAVSQNEVVDEKLDIHVPLERIFHQHS